MSEFFMTVPWLVYCAMLTVGSAGYGIAMRFVPAGLHPSLFGVTFTAISSSILLFLLGGFVLSGSPIEMTPLSIGAAVLAGVALVGVDLGIIAMYKAGAPVSIGMPIIRISLSMVMAIIGFTIYHEDLSVMKVTGILMGSLGIFLAVQKS